MNMLPRSEPAASVQVVNIPAPSAAASGTRRGARLNPRRRKAAARSLPAEVVVEEYPTDDSCDATNAYPRSLKAKKRKMSKLPSNKSIRDTKSPGPSAIAVPSGDKNRLLHPQTEVKPSVAHKMLIRKQEKQIRKLQVKAHDMSVKLEKKESLIAFKDLQIGIHHVVVETLKGMITCPLCMELMSEAHVLAPCGHSACLNCLYEHFRHKSCLAIRPDKELITGQPGLPDSDIRQRTKLCFMCRTPVLLRPAPLYLAKELIDNLIQARPPRALPIVNKPNPHKTLRRPQGDMWRFTFLKDSIRPRWHDEIDDVWRCGCGHEIDGVRCSNGCPGEFDPVSVERLELLVRDDGDEGEEEPLVDSQGASTQRSRPLQAPALNGAGRLSEAALMAHMRADNSNVSQRPRPSASMTATAASVRAGRAAMARAGITMLVQDEHDSGSSPPPHRRDSEVETEEDSEEDDPDERLSFIAYTDEEEEQQAHGNKRALSEDESDESDADWSEPKRRRIASDDSDDESVSDDFVPRSPPTARTRPGPATARVRARVVLSSDDE